MPTQRFWPCKTRYLVGPLSLFLCDGSTDSQIPDMQSAQEDLQKNNQELNDMCRDKTNKLTQMTNLYNLLKSRAMRSRMQTAASDTVSNSVIAECLSIPLASRSPLAPASISRFAKTPPYLVNTDGVEQLTDTNEVAPAVPKGQRQRHPVKLQYSPPTRPKLDGRNSMY